MLKINNLKVTTSDKVILNNFNLIINDGEIHAIMGQNGVGKSTLSRVIMGDANYKVINGEIIFNGDNLNVLSTDERAKKGIFLAMQYPMEIEGVSNQDFLRTALYFLSVINHMKNSPILSELIKRIRHYSIDLKGKSGSIVKQSSNPLSK